MAIGPIARALAQAAILGISVIARAIPAAYGAALSNARKGGMDAAKAEASGAGMFAKKRMNFDEALMVLNVENKSDVTPELVEKQYERYFASNAVEKGGSFYIQSKVYRAKELLDEYVKEKRREENSQ